MNARTDLKLSSEQQEMFDLVLKYYRQKSDCSSMVSAIRLLIMDKYKEIVEKGFTGE